MEAVSKTLILTGALIGLAGAGLGTFFALQDDFVIARIQCVAADNAVGALNCGDDGYVVDTEGDLCQIGNLGLYDSAFTPECAIGTDYEFSSFLDSYSGDPVNFGPLFPAQTDLAGILPDITTEEVEFTGCDEYFAELALVDGLFQGSVQIAVEGGIDALRPELVLSYQAGIQAVFDATDDLIDTLPETLVAVVAGTFAFKFGSAIPDNYDDTYPPGANTTLFEVILSEAGGGDTIAQIVAGAIVTAQTDGFLSTVLTDAVEAGFAVGTGSDTLSIVPDAGMWSVFGSTVGCSVVLAPANCTYIEFVVGVTSSPDIVAVNPDLALLQEFWTGLEAQLIVTLGATAEEFEKAVGEGSVLSLSLAKSTVLAIAQAGIDADSVIPEEFSVAYVNVSGSEAASLLCADVPGDGVCSFLELLTFLADVDNEDNPLDPVTANSLTALVEVLVGCEGAGFPTLTACYGLITLDPFGTFAIEGAAGVLGELYSLDEVSVAAYLESSADKCKEDEEDKAAIQNAQVLAPAGIGLSFLGVFAALIVMKALSGKSKKILGITVGVIALIGGFLFLGALLGIYNAPIYESVGSGGDPEDGANEFLTGPATIFALAGIGCSIAGPVLLIVGFAISSSAQSDEIAIMK